jgi:pimeloyl-ACP methyl ester carboxylesterase
MSALNFPLRLPWSTRLLDCGDGDALHVATYGLDRPRVLVCVPGLCDTCESFDLLAAALPPTYGVVAVDALGHGRSSKQRGHSGPARQSAALQQGLDALGVQPFALVGHSYGGVIAQQFADDCPDVPAVALLGTVDTMVGHPAAEGFAALAAALTGETVPDELFAMAGDSFHVAPDAATLSPYVAAMRLTPAYVIREVIEEVLHYDLSAAHGRWCPRVLVVGAENDKVIGDTGTAGLARALPEAEVIRIPATSHAMHWERPELVAAALAEFLDRVPNDLS